MDDNDGQMIFGDLVGLKLPDIRLTGEEKPRKTSPGKLVPTVNRTWARCVTGAIATSYFTAVDFGKLHFANIKIELIKCKFSQKLFVVGCEIFIYYV